MHEIKVSTYQARVILIALETLRDHYKDVDTFLGQTTFESFKETFEHVKSQVPSDTLK